MRLFFLCWKFPCQKLDYISKKMKRNRSLLNLPEELQSKVREDVGEKTVLPLRVKLHYGKRIMVSEGPEWYRCHLQKRDCNKNRKIHGPWQTDHVLFIKQSGIEDYLLHFMYDENDRLWEHAKYPNLKYAPGYSWVIDDVEEEDGEEIVQNKIRRRIVAALKQLRLVKEEYPPRHKKPKETPALETVDTDTE
jgi:hypothetical protein